MRRIGIALLLGCCLLTIKAQTQKESALPMPKVNVGDVAPDFTLVDGNGQPHSLHDYKGKKNVVSAFYVFAFTPN
jgi:cytochrome oxidase Cu insertion factor (SCO1/SenC/PrrC family)